MKIIYDVPIEAAEVAEGEGLDKANADCVATYPGGIPYLCTRPAGHAGDHLAHGGSGCVYARWSQDEPAARAA